MSSLPYAVYSIVTFINGNLKNISDVKKYLEKYGIQKAKRIKPLRKGGNGTVYECKVLNYKFALKEFARNDDGKFSYKIESKAINTINKSKGVCPIINAEIVNKKYVIMDMFDGDLMFLSRNLLDVSYMRAKIAAKLAHRFLSDILCFANKVHLYYMDFKLENALFKIDEGDVTLRLADFGSFERFKDNVFPNDINMDNYATFSIPSDEEKDFKTHVCFQVAVAAYEFYFGDSYKNLSHSIKKKVRKKKVKNMISSCKEIEAFKGWMPSFLEGTPDVESLNDVADEVSDDELYKYIIKYEGFDL